MKAVICTQYGPPEVLQIQEITKPSPKEGEILVKIFSTAVNSGDVRARGLVGNFFMRLLMRLILGIFKPRKSVLGVVFSGVVESVGDKVTRFEIGDKVFGMTGFTFGTYAEYLTIDQDGNVIEMPSNATYDEAAALVFGGHASISFLDKMKIKEKPGASILIIGATGSVGISAIQIAKYYNADITAVCGSEGKQLVESLGISKTILYDKEDFSKCATTFDFIFDAVGKTTKRQCGKLLKEGGVYKTVGGLEVATESKDQLELLKMLFEKDKLQAVIDRKYSLNQIVEAHRYVDTGRKKGNVVIAIVE